ncbi:MAG: hypothetical protein RBT47_00885 [Anaerolineae bacterium]|jgi:ribonuclease E|nr:hypothetical protein [Anaerolineae bacterium]
MARCPECNARLNTPSDLELWDHLFCEACGVELEVIELNPLELEVVYDLEEEDEDDSDEIDLEESDEDELDLDDDWEEEDEEEDSDGDKGQERWW